VERSVKSEDLRQTFRRPEITFLRKESQTVNSAAKRYSALIAPVGLELGEDEVGISPQASPPGNDVRPTLR
jgi:hypothetical protein